MKKVASIAAAIMLSAASYAQTWTLDKAHAKLGFTITHMMVSDVDGMFKDFDATITSARPDFSDAVLSMTAKTNSIFTDNDKRDEHLRNPDFFDADKNPTVAFKSRSMKKNGTNKYKVAGDLTMHGVTKPVVLDLSFRGPAEHPMSKKTFAGFKITGKVKRSDFKIGESVPGAMLSDEVSIAANGEFTKS
ncbi:MAG: YceI family protein [Bacteroidota bacterium]